MIKPYSSIIRPEKSNRRFRSVYKATRTISRLKPLPFHPKMKYFVNHSESTKNIRKITLKTDNLVKVLNVDDVKPLEFSLDFPYHCFREPLDFQNLMNIPDPRMHLSMKYSN